MKRVLLSTRLLPEGFAELQKQFEVVFPENETFTRDELIALLPHFDAFISTFVYPVDREMLDAAAQRVKIISNYGVGYNNIDIDYAAQLGIVVTNTPDPVIEPTAELALALMLAAARRIPECDRKVRMSIEAKITQAVITAVKELYGADTDAKTVQLQKTKKEFEGDLTVVVFPFAKAARKGPEQVANEIGEYLKANEPLITAFNVIKGFLNLSIAQNYWLQTLAAINANDTFGTASATEESPLVMIEYSSPNTNKPLHLGHIRNNLLGFSLGEIVKANGQKLVKTNIVNDRGIHICKSMLA